MKASDIPSEGRSARLDNLRRYRYELWRIWGPGGKYVNFIGLNPSTADELADDATIIRCVGFASRWGFDGLVMTNLFAFRATHPHDLKLTPLNPIGEDDGAENNMAIMAAARKSQRIVVAWGAGGDFRRRDEQVMTLLRREKYKPMCFGVTSEGYPRHPLRLHNDTMLSPYRYAS